MKQLFELGKRRFSFRDHTQETRIMLFETGTWIVLAWYGLLVAAWLLVNLYR